MQIFEVAIVVTVVVLLLVILWSGISYPGFLRAAKLGSGGLALVWGMVILFLASVGTAFYYIFQHVQDDQLRGMALLGIPMVMGIPFRFLIGFITKKWILKAVTRRMIRPASNADIGAVTKLIYTVLEEYGLQPDPDDTDADLKDLEINYLNNGGSFDVLLNYSGQIVGTVGILRLKEQECELRKMYLDSAERGKGNGKLLLEHGLNRAKELGFNRVVLETATVLNEAINLYRKYGFKKFDMENPSSRCDQMYYKEI
jgi:putative acetyltransferase